MSSECYHRLSIASRTQEYADSPRAANENDEPYNCQLHPSAYNAYAAIYQAWLTYGVPYAMKHSWWLLIEPCQCLSMLLEKRCGVYAFELLSEAYAWDAPGGVVVFNIPRMRCVICRPDRPALPIRADSALSWLRRESAIGISILPGAQYAFLHVLFNPLQTRTSKSERCWQLYESLHRKFEELC